MTTDVPTIAVPAHAARAAPVSLWAGVLGSPALWAIHLELNLMLVPWLCGQGKHVILMHLSTLILAALSAWMFVLCWREGQSVGVGDASDSAGDPAGRTVFLSILGMMISALFTTIIIAAGLAAFFLDPCWE